MTVELDDGTSASGAELLVAVGRRPATDGLGLETVGLEPGKPVEVGENLRSAAHDWLYAIGDANGRALLTHMGKYQGRIAADVILGKDARIVSDGPLSPRVIFTDPQVAAVGHTLASAEEAGLKVRALDVETGANAGASFIGRNAPGTSRLVVDEGGRDRRRHVHRLSRWRSPCTRRRSRSSASSGSSNSSTPSRASPPAASSG